ncbi:hypothetical protein C8F04DRAFT_1360859 [Mycena alexandri]|uniref:Uncharacterized protein n=1 Tax=Mycena alexandri TaxID=1745969 RepID=A0AAD6SSI1_9AGAR|nr:hypothetical protein C8F04DRAFT_1360859 [Mycena alexandri]
MRRGARLPNPARRMWAPLLRDKTWQLSSLPMTIPPFILTFILLSLCSHPLKTPTSSSLDSSCGVTPTRTIWRSPQCRRTQPLTAKRCGSCVRASSLRSTRRSKCFKWRVSVRLRDQPTDTRRWIRIDSAPPITWKLPDAWIWVGTPATVKMILNNHKAMHPHKDVNYTTPPVSATNLQNYWAHRQNYLTRVSGANSYPSNPGGTGTYNQSNTYYPASGSSIYSTAPNTPVQSTSNPSNLMFANNDINNPDSYPAKFNPAYLTSGYYSEGHPLNMNMNMNAVPQQQAFNTLAPQPVVVPAGFTETHASAPGWWRNPQTGWFWHAARGLLPPAAMTGGGPAGAQIRNNVPRLAVSIKVDYHLMAYTPSSPSSPPVIFEPPRAEPPLHGHTTSKRALSSPPRELHDLKLKLPGAPTDNIELETLQWVLGNLTRVARWIITGVFLSAKWSGLHLALSAAILDFLSRRDFQSLRVNLLKDIPPLVFRYLIKSTTTLSFYNPDIQWRGWPELNFPKTPRVLPFLPRLRTLEVALAVYSHNTPWFIDIVCNILTAYEEAQGAPLGELIVSYIHQSAPPTVLAWRSLEMLETLLVSKGRFSCIRWRVVSFPLRRKEFGVNFARLEKRSMPRAGKLVFEDFEPDWEGFTK